MGMTRRQFALSLAAAASLRSGWFSYGTDAPQASEVGWNCIP
jgi:hypothetical protein